MNNSVAALCRAVGVSLRQDVLPRLDDAYAQGQLAAAIYVLNNLERQAGWSGAAMEQESEQAETAIAYALDCIAELGLPAPALPEPIDASGDQPIETRRDRSNSRVCALLDWFGTATHEGPLASALRALESHLLDKVTQAVEQEKKTVAPSMMREMSGG